MLLQVDYAGLPDFTHGKSAFERGCKLLAARLVPASQKGDAQTTDMLQHMEKAITLGTSSLCGAYKGETINMWAKEIVACKKDSKG